MKLICEVDLRLSPLNAYIHGCMYLSVTDYWYRWFPEKHCISSWSEKKWLRMAVRLLEHHASKANLTGCILLFASMI